MGTVVSYGPEADAKKAQAQGRIVPIKARIDELQDNFLPFPEKGQFTEYQKQICFSCHATVYPRRAGSQENGDFLPVIGQRNSFYFADQSPDYFGRMRDLRYEYARRQIQGTYVVTSEDYDSSYNGTQSQTQLEKYEAQGLRPSTAEYHGEYMPKGTPVINGYPKHGSVLLRAVNPKYCTTKHGGKVYLLADYVDGPTANFNGLVKQYFLDHGEKFLCSGIRSFDGQISVRKRDVKNGTCRSMTVKFGGKCRTARPGTSPHGWGKAVDIVGLYHSSPKKDKNGNVIDASSFNKAVKKPKYLWLKQNGPKYNWHNPAWAVNVKGTPEAWHWEPTSTVLKNVRK